MKEYVPALTERRKWTERKRNVQVGDLVLLVDENTPRGGWPTGRVIETTTSSPLGAETVRSVKVRTETGEYRRPITKLCLLQTIDEKGLPELVNDVTDQPIHKNELATRK